jgi:hypothetical protein
LKRRKTVENVEDEARDGSSDCGKAPRRNAAENQPPKASISRINHLRFHIKFIQRSQSSIGHDRLIEIYISTC